MDCKALSLSSLFLLIAFFLTIGSVTSCSYQEFDCSLNETIYLEELSVDGNFSCIEWNGAHPQEVESCFLFVKTSKTRDGKGIINFLLNNTGSNTDDSLTIGYGNNSTDSSSILETVTNSLGWSKKGIHNFDSMWIAWKTSPDGKIKAQFQDLIFKQFPVMLHKENNGSFRFPNQASGYTYRPNSAFIWMLSPDVVDCESNCNETSMIIDVSEVSPSEESGDALIIGMGNKTHLFRGPNSLLLTERVTEPLNIHLTGGDTFVMLLTGRSVMESNVNFKVDWKRNSSKSTEATVVTTTAMPEAWLQAISLCIEEQSKEHFKQNITVFKEKVGREAKKFADDENIILQSGTITEENVEISETYFFELEEKGSNGVQIILTIVQQYDKTKAVFPSDQLQTMFRKPGVRNRLRDAGFNITECPTTPDYWDWFGVSLVAFVLSIAILLIVWYVRYRDFFKDAEEEVKKLIPAKTDTLQHKTVDNEYEQGYYTRESLQNIAKDNMNVNNVAHSEITTENHIANASRRVEKTNSDVGVRKNPAKSNPSRPTSDPTRLQAIMKNQGIESPKSILRKGVKADVHVIMSNVPITEEAQENVAEHLYDTVEKRKVVVNNEVELNDPGHYVNTISIEDEIEDTRC